MSRGYAVEAPQLLERAILEVVERGTVTSEEATEWGMKYVVSAEVTAPDGNPMYLDTVWIVVSDEAPILITAYPMRRRL